MNLIAIRQESEWHALEQEWRTLVSTSPSASTFLTWEWMWSWWQSYGRPGELNILAAYEGDTLRAVAPLRRQNTTRYGQTVPTLSFVGDGSNDSDYLDFLVARGFEEPAMACFRNRFEQDMKTGAVFLLNELPACSENLRFLNDLRTQSDFLWTERDVVCATVNLPETWDDYLMMLKPRFRTKVRSVLRSMESRSDVEFGFCETAEEALNLLPELFDLHARRWATEGKTGVFGWGEKREFYGALTPSLLESGSLRFSWLKWNNRILACQYGFTFGPTYYHLQEGYEPACEHWSVGIALRAWSIREMLSQGIREYDFLGGLGRHKTDWGASAKLSKQISIAFDRLRNRVFCLGGEWEGALRTRVRQVLPEALLKTRQKLNATPNGNHGSGEWARKAAAACYLRSGLPRAMRGVRERYSASFTEGFRLQRRHEPCGRILYYHRINDDNDPFFPAIATRFFDVQMQYVARHYNVVPLTELIARLGQGSPENMVAITFDDGYQDNFTCAYPVLQRYNLPATIFLTTGSIDSGEPLWFEMIAEAVQRTSKQYIDLEMDVPRRMWLRNTAERLNANGRIFSLLRAMHDRERRRWVRSIVKQLGPVETDHRGKMLTWNQVRQMRAGRIDFGGHTVSHPFVSKLTPEDAAWEVRECKRRIEQELGESVSCFAYPNGREEDFSPANKDLLRNAGYEAAVTTIFGINTPSTDPMELRRGGPWEDTLAMFAYKLDWYHLVNE